MLLYISREDFVEYMKRKGDHYIYHPYDNIAFRSRNETGDGKYYTKPKHGKETEIPQYDRQYLAALSYHIVMLPEDYQNF